MTLTPTKNTHPDFIALTRALDEQLHKRYGKNQADYDQYNKIAPIDTALIGHVGKIPLACGCFKPLDARTIEIKRMYVRKEFRRNGFSMILLKALEEWGARLGHRIARLETGKGQPEAIGLYTKAGYLPIENYGPYKNLPNSLCMEKRILPQDE